MTPFEVFYIKVRDLMDGDVARHLGSFFRDHPIYGPLEQLYAATYSISLEYGKEGPNTSWNRPFRTAGSNVSGSGCSNSSRSSTPLNNNGANGGLYPNWPNTPPPSRPGSWSSVNKMQELEAENHNLKQKVDNYKEELLQAKEECKGFASANKKILELESQLVQHEATLVRVRLRSAKAYVQSKRYDSAASEYEQVALLKKDEQKFKASLKDEEGKRKAEDEEAFYMFEQAKALASDEQHRRAEKVYKSIRLTKQRLGSHRAVAVDARDVQARLCETLTSQGKASEAKTLFLDAAEPLELGTLNTLSRGDCTWALQNALSYTRLLTKEGDYDRARYWIKRIWPNRHRATAEGLHDIEKETLIVAEILEGRGQSRQQMKLLETMCSNTTSPLSAPLLYCFAKLGSLYYSFASSNDDFANAAAYLRQAWTERQRLDINLLRGTGWTLALTLVRLKIYPDARDTLGELQRTNINDASDDFPANNQVQALLAHTQLMLAEFTAAETTATRVFKHCGIKNVLAGSTSSSLDMLAFHHADTLIRARVNQKSKEKFREARAVWDTIYKARQTILGSDKSGKAQLSGHVASGKFLADEWKKFAGTIPAKPVSAKEVRREVETVESLMR